VNQWLESPSSLRPVEQDDAPSPGWDQQMISMFGKGAFKTTSYSAVPGSASISRKDASTTRPSRKVVRMCSWVKRTAKGQMSFCS